MKPDKKHEAVTLMVTSLLSSPTVSKGLKHAYTTTFLSEIGLCSAIFSIVV